MRFENFIHSIESATKVSSHSSSSPLSLVQVANVHTHVFGKTDASRDMNPGPQRERLYVKPLCYRGLYLSRIQDSFLTGTEEEAVLSSLVIFLCLLPQNFRVGEPIEIIISYSKVDAFNLASY